METGTKRDMWPVDSSRNTLRVPLESLRSTAASTPDRRFWPQHTLDFRLLCPVGTTKPSNKNERTNDLRRVASNVAVISVHNLSPTHAGCTLVTSKLRSAPNCRRTATASTCCFFTASMSAVFPNCNTKQAPQKSPSGISMRIRELNGPSKVKVV